MIYWPPSYKVAGQKILVHAAARELPDPAADPDAHRMLTRPHFQNWLLFLFLRRGLLLLEMHDYYIFISFTRALIKGYYWLSIFS